MFKRMILGIILGVSVFGGHTYAAAAGFQLSLTPDIAIHEDTTPIDGVTLNVWGQNPQRALALGFINGSSRDSSGVSLGLLANYAEDYSGAHLAWFANYASGHFSGLQMSAFNYAESLNGVQLGWVNFAETVEKGLQVGLLNVIKNNVYWFGAMPEQVAPMMVLVNWRY
ncbi:MAG: hypothetical protein R6V18_00490 [Desulfuromonadaceae bacterium]